MCRDAFLKMSLQFCYHLAYAFYNELSFCAAHLVYVSSTIATSLHQGPAGIT